MLGAVRRYHIFMGGSHQVDFDACHLETEKQGEAQSSSQSRYQVITVFAQVTYMKTERSPRQISDAAKCWSDFATLFVGGRPAPRPSAELQSAV